jgi:diguanylate cyclase (GGDEF)-like protein
MKGWQGVGIDRRFGVEELAAVVSVPSSGWFVVARMPTSEVFAPLSRLHRFILSNTAYMVPLFFLVIVFLVRYLLRPLRNAAEHADRMTHGQIPFEPLPVVRDDEVGHLTQAFNRVLSKLIESRAELHHIAHHDPLTGLPNRQLLADRMNLALARAHRNEGRVAVLFLDLDGFKPVNDEMGHEAGDAALCEVAARLKNTLRREDTLARVGGDEFVVLLSDLSDNAASTVELVAAKCLDAFRQPFVIRDQPRRLGASIGVAVGSGNCAVDELLVAADRAMYQSKQEGGGKFCWAHECVVCLAAGHEASCGLHFLGEPDDINIAPV